MSNKTTIIISRRRGAEVSEGTLEQGLAGTLASWPEVDVVTVAHLYDLAPDGPAFRQLQQATGNLVVLASLFPRAAYWVLDANGVKGHFGRTSSSTDDDPAPTSDESNEKAADDERPQRTIWCFDLRAQPEAAGLLDEIAVILSKSTAGPVAASPQAEGADGEATRLEESTEFRWYPVIDYGRCANCLECLNFCLFGVFGVDESGQLIIEQPDACRDGCPACSRVCPSHAILFPHHNNPAIAGDPKATAADFNTSLVQLLDGSGLQNLSQAQNERDQALADRAATDAAPKDQLDELVDDLDAMDL